VASTHMIGFSGWNDPKRQDELLWYLFDRFRGLIIGVACGPRFRLQPADAEDMVHDLWFQLRGKRFDDFLEKYRVPGGSRSFKAWLTVCVRNRAINITQRQPLALQQFPNEAIRLTGDDADPEARRGGDHSFPVDEFATSIAESVAADFEADPLGPLNIEALQEPNHQPTDQWPMSDTPDSSCTRIARDRVRGRITMQNWEAIEMVIAGQTCEQIAAHQMQTDPKRTVGAVREAVRRAADLFRRFRNECLNEEASK
jgi:DNA-directed RNA polymerase specialized sigma24 family protein